MHNLIAQGWLCPRCGKVNAPHLQQCPCDGWVIVRPYQVPYHPYVPYTPYYPTWVGGTGDSLSLGENDADYCVTD